MVAYALTTVDNEFDPFDQIDEWRNRDEELGYNTESYLARVLLDAPYLSEEEEQLAINWAVEEIVKYNILGVYRKIEREFP